jgi:hypothetical protein
LPDRTGFASPDAALLLSFFASGNRSLLAAQAFVEAMLEAHVRGVGVDALEAAIRQRALQSKVAEAAAAEAEAVAEGAAGGAAAADLQRRRRRGPPPLLTPLDQDILLSWMLVTALAANELGIPFGRGCGGTGGGTKDEGGASGDSASDVSVRFSNEALGLLQYVKTTLRSYFDEGYTLSRVAALQALTSEQQQNQQAPPGKASSAADRTSDPADAPDPGPQGGRSQFAELMQQYTRLVLIAAEVASGLDLPTSRPLHPPSGALMGRVPSGYSRAFDFGVGGEAEDGNDSSQAPTTTAAPPPPDLRALAVRLVVAFMGAALGEGAYATNAFAACALDAYARGYSAEEVFSALDPSEFAQAGGVVRATGAAAAAARAAGGSASAARALAAQEVNARLFARWLSLAYFTAAQIGVPFPGAGEREPGWAWVPGGGEGAAPPLAPVPLPDAKPQAVEEKEGARGASPVPSSSSSSSSSASEDADDAVEAAALAAFVAQALALAAREDRQRERAAGADDDKDEEAEEDQDAASSSPEPGTLAARMPSSRTFVGQQQQQQQQKQQQKDDNKALLEQQRGEVARELAERGTVRGRPLPAMVRMPDPGMAATSAAVVAFRQQLGVVGAVRAVALAGRDGGGGGGGGVAASGGAK